MQLVIQQSQKPTTNIYQSHDLPILQPSCFFLPSISTMQPSFLVSWIRAPLGSWHCFSSDQQCSQAAERDWFVYTQQMFRQFTNKAVLRSDLLEGWLPTQCACVPVMNAALDQEQKKTHTLQPCTGRNSYKIMYILSLHQETGMSTLIFTTADFTHRFKLSNFAPARRVFDKRPPIVRLAAKASWMARKNEPASSNLQNWSRSGLSVVCG